MFKWICNLFSTNEKDKKMIQIINKLCEEHDVRIYCRGFSKTSKPEYKEKHRKELADIADKISRNINEQKISKE